MLTDAMPEQVTKHKVKAMNENITTGISSSSAFVSSMAPVDAPPKAGNDMPARPIKKKGMSDDTWWMIVILDHLIEYIKHSMLPANKIRLFVHQMTGYFAAPRYRRCLRVVAVWDQLHNLAVALYDARLYRLASEVYDFVLASVPGRGDSPRPGETSTWYSGGIIYMKARRYEDAAGLYGKLLKYADSEPRTIGLSRICLENMGYCYMKTKDYNEAAPIYVRFLNNYSLVCSDKEGNLRACCFGVRRNTSKLMQMGYIAINPCPGPFGSMSTKYVVVCPDASGSLG